MSVTAPAEDGIDILTHVGLAKIRDAVGSDEALRIRWIALGDGGGLPYDPAPSQTRLRRERLRTEISSHYKIGDNAWHVRADFPASGDTVTIREMGFFADDGTLISVWAGQDVAPRETGAHIFVLKHVIAFDGVSDGVITVEAADDQLFQTALITATAIANLQLVQLEQDERLRLLEGKL